ncbi:MAG: hypothetical protein Q4C96_00025 [Planctomycetia bacterium]|nr:hypothetical protein [Planctomycetia bacterium]
MADFSRKLKVFTLYVVSFFVLLTAIFYSTVPFFRKDGRSDNVIPVTKEAKKTKNYIYSVTMSPVGTVYFEHVPQRVLTGDANYNEMLVATRDAHKIMKTSYQTDEKEGFYARIPNFQSGLNWDVINTNINTSERMTFDKELLYQLKSDIHHLDPIQVMQWKGWSLDDVEEVTKNVGPFFANRGSRDYPMDRPKIAPYFLSSPKENSKEVLAAHADVTCAETKKDVPSPPDMSDVISLPEVQNYEVYTLWELSDKVAQVYQKQEVVEKIKGMAERMAAEIQAKLPPPEKRPRVGLLFFGHNHFTPFRLLNGGFGQAQYHVVQAHDAFDMLECYGNGVYRRPSAAGSTTAAGTTTDLEALVACNPDIIIFPMALSPKNEPLFQELLKLQEDPVAKNINAFKNNRVYPGGTPFQGPIYFLFQVEMAAKQIYPEIFGVFRKKHDYCKEEQLFSREELAQILKEAENEKE